MNPGADRVVNLEGYSRRPIKARPPETPAGSESTARMEREASRNRGDPRQPSLYGGVRRLNGSSIGRRTLRWESDPLVLLGARESRVHGEGVGQDGRGVRSGEPVAGNLHGGF